MRAPPELEALVARHAARATLWRPTLEAPLLATLTRLHDALAVGDTAILADLVWSTAPTPELLKAFAPPSGREKVRPIEGYEMQMEHAGFDIIERLDLARAAWAPQLDEAQRAAVEADARGAAKLAAWALRRA